MSAHTGEGHAAYPIGVALSPLPHFFLTRPQTRNDQGTRRQWESVEQFQQFFADPELQAFIATTGASPEPPQIIVAEALTVTQF